MTEPDAFSSPAPTVSAPEAGTLAAMVIGPRDAVRLTADGDFERLDHATAAAVLEAAPTLVCHARALGRRLGLRDLATFDILELFAFVHPARFILPTPRGVAAALDLPAPANPEDEAWVLTAAVRRLLADLRDRRGGAPDPLTRNARPIAAVMKDCGWRWAPLVLHALGDDAIAPPGPVRPAGLAVWQDLAEWSDHAPPPPPGNVPIDPEHARARLAEMLGPDAERRPSQADFASAVSQAFQPRDQVDEPAMVLAEAGTGVGKTLGYVAPASLWAERNQGTVWISTYTRNLQHQVDGELDRLYPDRTEKNQRVVVRKGRENYLCLLNLEDASRVLPTLPRHGVALGLMARWALATRDGDLVGGDFPAWLGDLLGRAGTLGLADRRGECVYSACPHYGKCFIEKSVRKARRADLVIANHALVMIQAAIGGDDGRQPTRLVFDEGHHIFDAADGAFAAQLSARETTDLRRWLIGTEHRRGGRARGLKRRLEDLIADDETALAAVEEILGAARALPAEGWQNRLIDGAPRGPIEGFLLHVRQQVYARVANADSPYTLETEARPPIDALVPAARALIAALDRLIAPMATLTGRLAKRLDQDSDSLDSQTRLRIEAAIRGLERRGEYMVKAWRDMVASLTAGADPGFVDWMEVERIDGHDVDVGLHRHWLDPMTPFAEVVVKPAHGLVVTSATLSDGSGDLEADWRAAERRTGADALARPAIRAQVPSPFDYPAHTRVFIVNDVRKDDMDQVAAAYRELFLAAGGGGLGLFTAIQRLRAVHGRIVAPLDDHDIGLMAQHVDGMDISTLIDIFRSEEDLCLLGTDAVRDGVDVPGRALRLIVFDRVPWPRPSILYRARRDQFGKGAYTDMLTRLRLKQAFGRLVRRAEDRGVFVLLDPMMPSRLLGAFPDGVTVSRCGLAEAVDETRAFLANS